MMNKVNPDRRTFLKQATSTMIGPGLTLPSDLFPEEVVATVTGLSGLAAGLVGTLFTIAVGVTVDRFSYGPAFVVAGCMLLTATACVLLLIKDHPQIDMQKVDACPTKTETLPYDDPT